jgi:hypothetical protein
MKKKKESKLVRISGIVTAAGWDDDAAITAVSISTRDEQEYLVVNRGKGRELLGLVQKEVEVTGTVRKKEDGTRLLTIRSYRLVERDDDERDAKVWNGKKGAG